MTNATAFVAGFLAVAGALGVPRSAMAAPEGDNAARRAAAPRGVSPRDVAAPQDSATSSEPGSELRVWLVTMSPGDAVWERFGHNAIRILDTYIEQDISYNWGIFNFEQPGFITRFLKGEMLYSMAPFWTEPMLGPYRAQGREIVFQELNLTPEERLALRDFVSWNALPENRDYHYDYFRDNCSTRVRDALDLVLRGRLSQRFEFEPTGTSWRFHIRRLTRMDPLLYTGMDVLLGTPGDRQISVWDEMFLPMTLRDAVREVTLSDENGVARPLVLEETVAAPGSRPPDAAAPPNWLAWYLLLGLGLGGTLAWTGTRGADGGARWARRAFGALGAAWSLLAGFVGTLLVLVLFTDHRFMFWNENLLLLSPLSLALVILAPVAARRGSRAAELAGLAVLALAVSCLIVQPLPVTTQDNGIFLALTLPIHTGLWWGARSLRRSAHGRLP